MTDADQQPAVEVTIGILGAGEQTIELPPGESIQQSFDEPSYVEVRALDTASDGGTTIEVGDTTIEQKETKDDDREWEVETVTCGGCGALFPQSYTRCSECGHSNPRQ